MPLAAGKRGLSPIFPERSVAGSEPDIKPRRRAGKRIVFGWYGCRYHGRCPQWAARIGLPRSAMVRRWPIQFKAEPLRGACGGLELDQPTAAWLGIEEAAIVPPLVHARSFSDPCPCFGRRRRVKAAAGAPKGPGLDATTPPESIIKGQKGQRPWQRQLGTGAAGAAEAVISGYRCELMDRLYKGWRRFDADEKHCHSIKKPRRESVWMNC